jgi:hypothetical protein
VAEACISPFATTYFNVLFTRLSRGVLAQNKSYLYSRVLTAGLRDKVRHAN